MRRRKRWTPEEQQRLASHFAEGTCVRRIAKKLGRSVDAVEGRLTAIAMRHRLQAEPMFSSGRDAAGGVSPNDG
ncbi:MAG: hypothetical protein CFE29_01720 [Bradyrhizobiaceae bacterium PARB1]|nr:MAG: hypothetical protein CFE29_01720 [Bradyrhizobiaceae bacterium PARB1]